MNYLNRCNAKKLTGLNYLGSVNLTTKHAKAYDYDELTYSLYLAPAKMSGYEVCPKRNEECTSLCLNESGMNRIDVRKNTINESRIKKTKLFFEEREFFVNWLIDEISITKKKAENLGYKFSVRLNNTSDISPELFYTTIDGKKKNLLEIFPDVQFYDYTKIINRNNLPVNYDLTFSYSGKPAFLKYVNQAINKGMRIAVVFKDKYKLPTEYMGLTVVNGDNSDIRHLDNHGVIVALYAKGKAKQDTSGFVVHN